MTGVWALAGDRSTGAFELLQAFLDRLDADRITYRMDRIRDSSVLVEVYLPGFHWEVEFFWDGHVEAERYSAGEDVYELTRQDPDELVQLLGLDQEPPDASGSG
jgi:hypothetical protein